MSGHALPFVVSGYVHALTPSASGIKDADGMWVAKMHPLNGDADGIQKSEELARQFAATPLLIAALKSAVITLEHHEPLSNELAYVLAVCRDALAEVTPFVVVREPAKTKRKAGGAR